MPSIEKELLTFLNKHYNSKKPILLGLSGGPDSLLLFHLLLKFPIQFGIAHVDHGWRKESSAEANTLAQLAAQYQLTFHLLTLNPAHMRGNLEQECREARLNFFEKLCQEFDYQAVILGHHAGDLVETVFKRLLEGTNLSNLCGLNEITNIKNMTIWRPLLKFHKNEILDAIEANHLNPFEDATNKDPKFLRARLRTRIFPQLAQEFGKEINHSLECIGNESKELKDFLNHQLQIELESIKTGPFGLLFDFNNCRLLHPYELKFFIRKFCEKGDFYLSRDFLEKTVKLLQTHAANKEIVMGIHKLYIDRGRLFLIQKEFKLPNQPLEIKEGHFEYGLWQVKVDKVKNGNKHSNWRNAWEGNCEIYLPYGHYFLGPAILKAPYHTISSISKWWTNAKVPAFFRHFLPVICSKNIIYGEFLTGRMTEYHRNCTLRIKMQFD